MNLYTNRIYKGSEIQEYVECINPNSLLSRELFRRYWKYDEELGFPLCCLNTDENYYIERYNHTTYDYILDIPIEEIKFRIIRVRLSWILKMNIEKEILD